MVKGNALSRGALRSVAPDQGGGGWPIQASAQRFAARLLEHLPAAVVVGDENGIIRFWNDAATDLYGYSSAETIGRPFTELLVGPTGTEGVKSITRTLRATGRWEGSYEARRAGGSVIPIHLVVERIDDEELGVHGVVGTSLKVEEHARLEEDRAFAALHDELTGLPNRRLFVECLADELARSDRSNRRSAVLVLDIDDFKGLNDRRGALVGDEVLRAVATLLEGILQPGDLVARVGGDRFVVCCHDASDAQAACGVADRIRRALASPFGSRGDAFTVSAGIGIAFSVVGSKVEGLLRNADVALHEAKSVGRGQVAVFDDDAAEQERRWHRSVIELEEALDGGQIHTHFQPEIDLATGHLVGFEALARWSHPARGAVAPDVFIPLAEGSGLITRITEVVLADACCAVASWRELAPERSLQVAVNISPRQLSDPDLPTMVAQMIERAGIPPDRICLEVTESALADANAAASTLQTLRSIGVRIAIDDFGTGYSSLSNLQCFQLDYLKVDRSFVAGLSGGTTSEAIVSAILGIAKALGLRTIAEGVEDEHQLERVTALGCDIGQGYLWSRPVTFSEATLVVRRPGPVLGADAVGSRSAPAEHPRPLAAGDLVMAGVSPAPSGSVDRFPRRAHHASPNGAERHSAGPTRSTTEHPDLLLPELEQQRSTWRKVHVRTHSDAQGGDVELGATKALLDATHALLWIREPHEASDVTCDLVRRLGGGVVPATDASPEALPIDISFATGPTLLPAAPVDSVARMLLERHLASFVEECHRAVGLLRNSVRLTEEASIDPLTGLANRRASGRALGRLEPGDMVMLIDLDHFKQVNDRFGHDEGDRVLRVFARALRSELPMGAHAGRQGGEEFLVALQRSGRPPAAFFAGLVAAWEEWRPQPVSFSAGVAVIRTTAADAIAAADAALYRAKAGGRAQLAVADEGDER